MKGLLFSIILIFVVKLTTCATWMENASDIRHPGRCSTNGIILSAGEEYDPKDQCIKLICGEGSVVTGFNCGSRSMSNCEDLGYSDVSKPYPDCCVKKFKCEKNDKEHIVLL